MKAVGKTIEVGFFPEDRYVEEDIPVAQVAYWNDMGTTTPPRTPERPFFRQSAIKLEQYWKDITDYTDESALLSFERKAIYTIRWQAIVDGVWQPNAPRTIVEKGHAKPLIDTKRMFNSVKTKRT